MKFRKVKINRKEIALIWAAVISTVIIDKYLIPIIEKNPLKNLTTPWLEIASALMFVTFAAIISWVLVIVASVFFGDIGIEK